MRLCHHLPPALTGYGRRARRPPSPTGGRAGLSQPRSLQRLAIVPLPGEHGLALIGELDASAQAAVTTAIDATLETSRDLVLDLAGLRFMDSTGIHALLRAASTLSGDDRITVRHARPSVRWLLLAAGMRDGSGLVWIEPDGEEP